jgi:hypothetical protein
MDLLAEEMAEMHAARASVKYRLGEILLLVLSSGRGRGYPKGLNVSAEDWAKEKDRLQTDLTTLSRNSKRILAETGPWRVCYWVPLPR